MSTTLQGCSPQPGRDAARAWFRRALRYNQLAHGGFASDTQGLYTLKTKCVEEAIQLAPTGFYVDDFHLSGGGTVGITFPGVGRLHVKLGGLSADVRHIIWEHICQQCSAHHRPAA